MAGKSEDKSIGTLTCPKCGHKQEAPIPSNICVHSYKCDGCGETISGKERCVFCTYGDKPCPSGC